MRRSILCMIAALLIPAWVWAQETVRLGQSSFVPEQNMRRTRGAGVKLDMPSLNGQRNVLLQFSGIPSRADVAKLHAQGVELRGYLGGNAYWALLSDRATQRLYTLSAGSVRISSVMQPRAEWKMGDAMARWDVPDWALAGRGCAKVSLRYAENARAAQVKSELQALGVADLHVVGQFQRVEGLMTREVRDAVAALPYVLALEFAAPSAAVENYSARKLSRANVLNRPISLGGRDLHGKGVRVGIWDATVDRHPDFANRVHVMEAESENPHGTHVTGSVMGAGLIDPKGRGMADQVEAWTFNFNRNSNGLTEVEEMAMMSRKYNIALTQNSYGTPLGPYCQRLTEVVYTQGDQDLDRLAIAHPNMLHVFAAGNEQNSCMFDMQFLPQFGIPRYRTTTKRCKNTLYIGAVDETGGMSRFSSWGPQDDGRMFPTICAKGAEVYSTIPDAGYGNMSGTSMACPVASGSMALLVERYAQMHKGENIPAALLKAVVANTANDVGNPHCDFKFGYGILNVEAAAVALEKQYYNMDLEVGNAETQTVKIPVPKGIATLRVMLYWVDPVPAKDYPFGQPILTNNLDLTVSNGSGEVLPWVCDHTGKNVTKLATQQVDNLNNMEQVTIEGKDISGAEVTAKIVGTKVPDGKQKFVLTWWYEMENDLRLLSPAGSDTYAPGETTVVQVEGLPSEMAKRAYSVEISYDGAKNFSKIAQVPAADFSWSAAKIMIPSDAPLTRSAYVRVIDGAGNVAMNAHPFTIAPVPTNLLVEAQACTEGNWRFAWDAVPGSTKGYSVYLIGAEQGVVTKLADASTNEFTVTQDMVKNTKGRKFLSVAVNLDANTQGQRAKAVYLPATAPIMLSKDNPFFDEYFTVAPSTNFHLKTGAGLRTIYQSNPARPVLNARYFGFQAGGTPAGFTFNSRDWFSDENEPVMATVTLCGVDLTQVPSAETIYFRMSVGLGGTSKNISKFRVLDGATELPDQHGIKVHTPLNLGMTDGSDLHVADYVYALHGGAKHTIRVQFVAAEPGALFAFAYMGLQPASKKGLVEFLSVKGPESGVNLGKELYEVMVGNPTSVPVKDVEVKYTVNGKVEGVSIIPEVKAFGKAQAKTLVDLSTKIPLGERKEVSMQVTCPRNPSIQPYTRNLPIDNLGDVLPIPETKVMVMQMGIAQMKVRQIHKLERPMFFTDYAGALGDYQMGQDAIFKVLPPQPGMAVQVTFKNVDLSASSKLNVYESTISDNLDIGGKTPAHSFTEGKLTQEMTFTSRARDGALTFFFESLFSAKPAPGWVAELKLVPTDNALTMLSAQAELQSPNLEPVPVKVRFRSNWSKPIPEATIHIYQNDQLVFTEPIKDIKPGEQEHTLKTKLNLQVGVPVAIKAYITSKSDMDPSDLSTECRGLLDKYCFTDQLEGGAGKPMLASISHAGQTVELGEVTKYNKYMLSSVLTRYTQHPDKEIAVRLSSPAQGAMMLRVYVDWDDNGDFNGADELQEVEIREGSSEATFSQDVTGKTEGNHRIRLVYAYKTAAVGACIDRPAEVSMYDFTLGIISGSHPSAGDIALKSVLVGDSHVLGNGETPITIRLANMSNEASAAPFSGAVTVKVELDGVQKFSEVISCATNQLNPQGGEQVFPLSNKLPAVADLGGHKLKVTIEVAGDANASNNVKECDLLRPDDSKLYSLAFHTYQDQNASLPLPGVGEQLAGKTGVTLESWVRADELKLGFIYKGEGVQLAVCGKMDNPPTANAIVAIVGQNMLMWSDANTIKAGEWTHVALVLDKIVPASSSAAGSCEPKLYINGESVKLNIKAMDAPSFAQLTVGTKIDANLKGLRVWAKACTAAEIKGKMNERLTAADKDCLAAFPILAGTSSTVYNALGQTDATLKAYAWQLNTLWAEESLLKSLSFAGQLSKSKQSDGSYKVLFPHGAALNEVTGTFLSTWGKHVAITHSGAAVAKDTKYDLSAGKTVEVKLTAKLFGKQWEQTIKITGENQKSAECKLLTLELDNTHNPGLNEKLAVPIEGNSVQILIPAAKGKLDKPEAVKLTFTASPDAKVEVNGELLTSATTPVNLTKPIVVTVIAADGEHSQTYVLSIIHEQTVTLAIKPKTSFELGDAPVAVESKATSDLPLAYTSSESNVAVIVDGKLYISGVGTADLRAVQQGNLLFKSAESDRVTVTVAKRSGTVTPRIANVQLGQPIAWDFSFSNLAAPSDAFRMPTEKLIAAYEIRSKSGEVVDPRGILPIGEYTVALRDAAKNSLESALYNLTLQDGTFSVEQGSVYRVELLVQDEAKQPLPTALVRSRDSQRPVSATGQIVWLRETGEAHKFLVMADQYQPQEVEVLVNAQDVRRTVTLRKTKYAVTYIAEGEGTVNGLKKFVAQVAEGQEAPVVLAQADDNCDFVVWSDNIKEARRHDLGVTKDATYTAKFVHPEYTLKFIATTGGKIASGKAEQVVKRGENSQRVVVAPTGNDYYFLGWNDGMPLPFREEVNVQANADFTASFSSYRTLPDQENFEMGFRNGWVSSAVAAPEGIWKVEKAGTKVAQAEPSKNGQQVIAILTSPRYLTQSIQGDVVVAFDLDYYKQDQNNHFIVQYSTTGGFGENDWVDLEDYKESVKQKAIKFTIPKTALKRGRFFTVRWIYAAVWGKPTILDNISIYEAQNPSKTYTFSYRSNPEGKATFRVGGEPVTSQKVKSLANPRCVTVEPAAGYRFEKWGNGLTTNPYIYETPALKDEEMVAYLVPVNQVEVTYATIPAEGGKITRDGEPIHGENLQKGVASSLITAQPNPGFRFLRWSDNSSTQATRTVTVNANAKIEAIFERAMTNLMVSVLAEGKPVPDATVFIASQVGKTDASGMSSFSVAEGPYELVVEASEEYGRYVETLEVKGRAMPKEVHLFRKQEQAVTFVVKNQGNPLVGAQIAINKLSLRTDASGRLRVELPAATYHYAVACENMQPQEGDVTLAAKESKVVPIEMKGIYTVTFDFNNGSGTKATQTVKEGELVKKPAEPVLQGKVFDGWFDGKQKYDFQQPVMKSFTLTAHWADPTPIHTPVVESTASRYSLSPNPVANTLRVEGLRGNSLAQIYSVRGELVYSATIAADGLMHLAHLASGVYILRVEGQTLRFVKM